MARVDGHALPITVRDASRGGVLVFAPLIKMPYLRLGAVIRVTTKLPGADGELEVDCTVRSLEIRPDHDGVDAVACGCQFHKLDRAAESHLDEFFANHRETVLVVDDDVETHATIERALERDFDVIVAPSGERGLEILGETEVAVLIVAREMRGMDGKAFLREMAERHPDSQPVKLVLTPGGPAAPVELLDWAKIFYFVTKPVVPGDLLAVVKSAAAQYRTSRTQPPLGLADETAARRTQRVLEISRQLANQRDLATAGRLTIEGVEELLAADRALYYIYDSLSETLWTAGERAHDGQVRIAIAGLSGWVSRTGAGVHVPCAKEDKRYRREIDDPTGDGDEQLLVEPLLTPDRRTLAVVVAVRRAKRPMFSEQEVETFRLFASQCAAAYGQMSLQAQVEEVFAEQGAEELPSTMPFRREALDVYWMGEAGSGQPLRISPVWGNHVYWLVVVAAVSFLVYAVLGTIDEYATGPAIVRIDGRTDITATAPSIVASVLVQPGERVEAKQLLVRFYDAQESTQLDRIKKEFELQLIKVLRNPADPALRESLGKLRAERDFAVAQLEERSIRAPHAGIVNDIRIRVGQHLPVGTPILSITRNDSALSIVALISGGYRPMLRPGQTARLEINGFRYSYRELTVEAIGDEVVGPEEARRYLGPNVADSVQLSGPVILVRAKLPARTFNSDGRVFSYHDGMHGTAEVRVRTESILLTLVPGLKWVLGDGR